MNRDRELRFSPLDRKVDADYYPHRLFGIRLKKSREKWHNVVKKPTHDSLFVHLLHLLHLTSVLFRCASILYQRECPSIGPSVGPSVSPSHFCKKVKKVFIKYLKVFKVENGPRISIRSCIHLLVRSLVREREVEEGISCSFLDASSHLYKRVCPTVGRSVGRSVRWSVLDNF